MEQPQECALAPLLISLGFEKLSEEHEDNVYFILSGITNKPLTRIDGIVGSVISIFRQILNRSQNSKKEGHFIIVRDFVEDRTNTIALDIQGQYWIVNERIEMIDHGFMEASQYIFGFRP
jgi:hypothetical protein